MALSYAHGAIQWAQSDTATTVKTVSGLSFQPVAIRFYTLGISSATDATTSTQDLRACVGFAVGTADRRCVFAQDDDANGTMACVTGYRTDCVVASYDYAATPAVDGLLDLNSITSDGFTCIVDDQLGTATGSGSITVFWEAWGGSDITVAVIGEISEPAATGNQDYTVSGFTSGATDQVVMFAGVQGTASANTATRNDSGFCIGYAAGTSAGENIVIVANNDDGSATADTDSYALDGECLAMTTVAGGNPSARATLTNWGTDNFRLNWIARATTNRKSIFLAIKGGRWNVGSFTIDSQTLNATATVSGLSYAPVGLSLISKEDVEDSAGTAVAFYTMYLGCGSSTSSRRAMTVFCNNASTNSEVSQWVEYDQVLKGGATAYDINAMNSDGFQLINDDADAGEPTTSWIGYLTFGSAPAGKAHPFRGPRLRFQRRSF